MRSRILSVFLFFLYVLLGTSCTYFKNEKLLDKELERRNSEYQVKLAESEAERQLHSEVMEQFDKIREWISQKKFDKAEARLAELENMTEYAEDLKDLRELLALARHLPLDDTGKAIDQQAILNEAANGVRLPKKYNKSVTEKLPEDVDDQHQLEELLERRISIKVSNMPLGELAMQLRDLEGLNIADPVNVIFNDDVLKGKAFTANFKNVPLREVFDYISYNLDVDFNIQGNMIWVTKASTPAKGPRLITKTIELKRGLVPTVPEGFGVVAASKAAFETKSEKDQDLENALKAFYAKNTTGGSYVLFPQRNVLMVTDTLANIRKVEKLVEVFSKPPRQVLIEAKFVMVSENDLKDVGVEITKANGGQTGSEIEPDHQENANISDFFTKLGLLAADNSEGVGSMMVSGILGNRSFDLLIRALESKNSTVTLSSPRITTMNNRTARIRKGNKLLYFEQYSLQTVDNGDNGKESILVPTGKPTSVGLGITFDVIPSVGADGKTILLGLKPEIINFMKWEDYMSTEQVTDSSKNTTTRDTQVKLPVTHEQTIATSVSIRSGETVILGGMVENYENTVVKKIPLLGDIPWLGALFRHRTTEIEPTNLLIFVTATIINENGENVIVSK